MLTTYVKLKIQSSTMRKNVKDFKVNKSKVYSNPKFENLIRKVLTNSKSYYEGRKLIF